MSEIWSLIGEPFQYGFMVRGIVAAVTVGAVCSVLGTFVVLRGMAFFGDALAHAILPGIVLAFILGLPLALGALIFGVLTAVGIGALSSRALIKEDTAIGVVFAGAFALGVALLSATRNYTIDLAHFLFGNPLGVSDSDLRWVLLLGLLVMLTVIFFYKEFMVITFDQTLAKTLRLPATALRYLLLILIAVTIVIALQAVGIALVVAMLVTPAAAAYLLTQRLWRMMVVAGLLGSLSGLSGLYLSYYLNIAPGPAVVLVATALFLVAYLLAPGRGTLWLLVRR